MNLKHLPIGKLIKLSLLPGFRAIYHPIVCLPSGVPLLSAGSLLPGHTPITSS